MIFFIKKNEIDDFKQYFLYFQKISEIYYLKKIHFFYFKRIGIDYFKEWIPLILKEWNHSFQGMYLSILKKMKSIISKNDLLVFETSEINDFEE